MWCVETYPTPPSSPPTLRSGAGSTTISPTRHALDLHRFVYVPTWMVFHSRRLSRLPTASPSTFVHLLAVVVGGWCWGCGDLIGLMFACFMWTLMNV